MRARLGFAEVFWMVISPLSERADSNFEVNVQWDPIHWSLWPSLVHHSTWGVQSCPCWSSHRSVLTQTVSRKEPPWTHFHSALCNRVLEFWEGTRREEISETSYLSPWQDSKFYLIGRVSQILSWLGLELWEGVYWEIKESANEMAVQLCHTENLMRICLLMTGQSYC